MICCFFVIERGGIFVRQEHSGRVFRLQFDEFQIVSSSHDDTILIWDFLNYNDTNNSAAGTNDAHPPLPPGMLYNNCNNNEVLLMFFYMYVNFFSGFDSHP